MREEIQFPDVVVPKVSFDGGYSKFSNAALEFFYPQYVRLRVGYNS